MPTPVFPNAYQVETRGTLFGQLIENVYHVQGPDPFDTTAAGTIADIFSTFLGALTVGLSQDISFGEVFIHNLAGAASGNFTLPITPAQAGQLVQDSEPGSVAFCVSLRTALAGRTTRGRKYYSGLAVGDVTGNMFDATRAGVLVAAVNSLISDLNGNLTPLSIFSRTALTLVPVTAATQVDLAVDSQRRRLAGRGR